MKKYLIAIISSITLVSNSFAQENQLLDLTQTPLYVDSMQLKWVDEKYNSLSLDEKVGQLFIVAAYSNRDATHEADILKLIQEEKIGGLIFMQDQAVKQIDLTNRYQATSKIPLMIGVDGEWGLAMRLKGVERFPWNMTMGALDNEDLVYKAGIQIGKQSNRMGIHFNFAPSVDVNVNPNNPIIGNRSYGSDPTNVASKGSAFMRGQQSMKVLASAKHFPGHGDTDQDSHKTLPLISANKADLEKYHVAPFRELINNGVQAVMVAHLNVPALEPDPKIPSTLSKNIITDYLKGELNFKGIVITDALNMDGVAKMYAPGDVDYKAFVAGNDILLFSQGVKVGKQKIIAAIEKGEITEDRLAESVKKILMAKYLVGLNNFQPLNATNVFEDLNSDENTALTYKIFEEATTVTKNENQVLPIKDVTAKIAFVPLEQTDYKIFHEHLKKYADVKLVKIDNVSQINKLNDFDYVIYGAFLSNETVYKPYKLSAISKAILKATPSDKKTILSLFTSPYGLKDLDLSTIDGVVVNYQNTDQTKQIAPQIIFGAIPAKGKLPVTVNESIKYGNQIKTKAIQRLGFDEPANVGVEKKKLNKLDDLAQDAVNKNYTPGMQIVVAKDGKVIYDKVFGTQDIKTKNKLEWDHLYDVASVTKVTASIPLIMKEFEVGKMNFEQTLGELDSDLKNTNKTNLKVKEVLAHQSGLAPWIGFYKETVNVKNARLYLDFYSRKQDEEHNIKVTDNIYILTSIKDSIFEDIAKSTLGKKTYEYSDLGYYIFQKKIEKDYQKNYNEILQEKFYRPMGMYRTTYNPKEVFDLEYIVPTAYDKTYRNQLVHGFVHDQGAAMMGGIAGHAGLFSNAMDMAKLMQMYLNRGSYGGQQFIKPEILEQFSAKQYPSSNRGAGFDKTLVKSIKGASADAYGHFGFTGTMVWVDPKYNLVYVFLSNRVNVSEDNNLLSSKKVRENILQAIYDSILP